MKPGRNYSFLLRHSVNFVRSVQFKSQQKDDAMKTLTRLALYAGCAYAGLNIARKIVRLGRHFDWNGKRVIITGGSRGLGLVLARQLAGQGARIAICSRDDFRLQSAFEQLQNYDAEILTIPCDVRNSDSVQTMVAQVANEFGGIDVLLNVAGVIEVGPLDSMELGDFENSMQTNCWGALRTTLAVLPYMRQQGWGRIVNVASLGGKRAIPHMLPYAASKFALVGLSNGLRAELLKENIFVTTACPSLMRTGSPRHATFKGKHREEYAWFAIGDSLPVMSMDAELAAEQILRACQDGRGEVFIRNNFNITVALQQLFPEFTNELLSLANYLLPEMGGIGQNAAKGFESESDWTRSPLTYYTQKAAQVNNEN